MANDSTSVRVRFAPSPTGLLHIGGLRTALYNYLFARKHDGQFILRIEDTDRSRYVPEAEADIEDALRWGGLKYDEGPAVGGPHAPYYQSERSDSYHKYARRLVERGHAYYAFDTPEELEALRQSASSSDHAAPKYDASTRGAMTNALTLSEAEVEERLERGDDYVVRLKTPPGRVIQFDDEVRGAVSFESDALDDQVLLKSDGLPTYHLANVVDDHAMQISHVIRGEEWLSSTPKHILLYEALGWESPRLAHLPLIMSPDGGKLSKRDAETAGIPVNVRDYREEGYEPEAVVNFLAFLGWNPGTEQELFSLCELAEAFSLDRVGSAGVQFDADKLNWFNQQHVGRLDAETLAERARPILKEHGYAPAADYLHAVVELVRDRMERKSDLATRYAFFWEDPSDYDEEGVEKRWKEASSELLRAYADRLEYAETFDEDATNDLLRDLADEHDVGAGSIIHPTRLAVSGRHYGPSLFAMMAVLGRERCVRRMHRAAETLG